MGEKAYSKNQYQVLALLASYFNSCKFSDLTIVAPDGRRIKAHQLILSSASKRFCRLLESGAIKDGDELPVWGVDSDALETVIQTFYTGECALTPASVIPILDAAERLEVRPLEQLCTQFVQGILSPGCVCLLLGAAVKHNMEGMVKQLMQYWGQQFNLVVSTSDFLSAPVTVLAKAVPLLSCGGSVDTRALMHAVWRWLVAEPAREQHINLLLPWIQLPEGLHPADLFSPSTMAQYGIHRPPAVTAQIELEHPAAFRKNDLGEGGAPAAYVCMAPVDSGCGGLWPLPELQQAHEAAAAAAGPAAGMGVPSSQLSHSFQPIPVLQQPTQQAIVMQGLPSYSLLQPYSLPFQPAQVEGTSGGPVYCSSNRQLQGCGQAIIMPLSMPPTSTNTNMVVTLPGGQQAMLRLQDGMQRIVMGAPHMTDPVSLAAQAGCCKLDPAQPMEVSHGSSSMQPQPTSGPAYLQAVAPAHPLPESMLVPGDRAGSGQGQANVSPAVMPLPLHGLEVVADHPGPDLNNLQLCAATHPETMLARNPKLPSAEPNLSGGSGNSRQHSGQFGGLHARLLAEGEGSREAETSLPSPQTPGTLQKAGRGRGRVSSSGKCHLPRCACQVEGCDVDLTALREYHQRYRICEGHLKAHEVIRDGQSQRFCQQCGRFHSLSEFEGQKRSCRERLQRHNDRRRKRARDDVTAGPTTAEAHGVGFGLMDAHGHGCGQHAMEPHAFGQHAGGEQAIPVGLAPMSATMHAAHAHAMAAQQPAAASVEEVGGGRPGVASGLRMLADLANLSEVGSLPTTVTAPRTD